MELTKEIAQMICDLEYRIGACCYNPHSTNGYTGEIGRTLRFPVTVYDEEKEHVEHKTRNNYRYYISNPEDVKKLTYLVGANHFHIGVGLIRVLRYLESEYKINFNELEDARQKRIQKEEAQREKLEKVLPRDAVWEAISEYGEEHYEAFSISGWQVATHRYEPKNDDTWYAEMYCRVEGDQCILCAEITGTEEHPEILSYHVYET